MEKILKDLQKYKEPKFGSFKWLSCQAGLQKISKLIEEDKDIKEALHNLIAMSVQGALTEQYAAKPVAEREVPEEVKAHCNCQNGFINYRDRGRLCAKCGKEMR